MIRGGGGKAARGALQPGNRLHVAWKARLAEHLGTFTWELAESSGIAWLDDPLRLAGVVAACALAEIALPERVPQPGIFAGLIALFDHLSGEDWPSLYVHWELGVLAELGFGLDLSRCAATGQAEDLAYVSPRSGRAVSRSAGEPYRERLLVLPRFLLDRTAGSDQDVVVGLALTGHFLERHVLAPQGGTLPPARARLLDRFNRR